MSIFNRILVAVDVSEEAELVTRKANDIATKYGADIILIHVVEAIIMENNYDLVPMLNTDIEDSLVNRSKTFLDNLIKKQDLKAIETIVPVGSTKAEIQKAAKSKEVDLIIIGTHGRHGVARLLGSTANAILHGASCDILCVKIAE